MAPETAAAPIQTYLDMLALAIAAGAKWWRDQLTKRYEVGKHLQELSPEKLDYFERELCIGMMKLLLRNALERGLSWKEWNVGAYAEPHGALRGAALNAGVELSCFPHFTHMFMRSTNDQVHIEVRFASYGEQAAGWAHVWPAK